MDFWAEPTHPLPFFQKWIFRNEGRRLCDMLVGHRTPNQDAQPPAPQWDGVGQGEEVWWRVYGQDNRRNRCPPVQAHPTVLVPCAWVDLKGGIVWVKWVASGLCTSETKNPLVTSKLLNALSEVASGFFVSDVHNLDCRACPQASFRDTPNSCSPQHTQGGCLCHTHSKDLSGVSRVYMV